MSRNNRISSADRALIAFDAAKKALAQVCSIDELRQVRDQAEALRAYYRQASESLDMQNACARIKLRAERRIGEMLRETIPHQGGRPQRKRSHHASVLGAEREGIVPTLSDLGLNASQSSRYQSIARIPEPVFEQYVGVGESEATEELTTAGLLRAGRKAGVTTAMFSSQSEEWYTPRRYLDCARKVMRGEIELDPASCARANRVVRAKRYYTAQQDGLSQSWEAKSVWLNPPYGSAGEGRSNQSIWTKRLIDECAQGSIGEAIALVNAATASAWFNRLWKYSICFAGRRIRFETPEGEPGPSPTHASVFVYMGPNPKRFAERFSSFGRIVVPGRLADAMGISVSLEHTGLS